MQNPSGNNALLISATDTVEASTLHFTPDDLNAVDHVYGLQPRRETILSVNYGSLGTGGATCGPGPLTQYQLPSSKVYEWEFTMMPVAGDATAAQLSDTAKSYHTAASFSREDYDKEKAEELIKRIDSFVVYDYSQLADIEDLQADVNAMTDAQKKLVNEDKNRTELVEQYLKEVKALADKETYLQDESKHQMQIPYNTSAAFKKDGETVVMNGQLAVPFNDILNPVLEGKNSFTIEVNMPPRGSKDYNMFAGKGDYAFALRSREESKVDFHIYAGGSWRSILFDDMPAEMKANWQNHEHQVVGIYDDVAAELSKVNVTSINKNDETFSVGYEPQKAADRQSELTFEQVRVFSQALTVDELNNAKAPAAEDVVLWLEFEDEDSAATKTDKENLRLLVESCQSQMKEDYLETGWAEFDTALADAAEVLGNEAATKAEVQTADTALREAKKVLVYVKDLKDAVNSAKEEVVPQKDTYTVKSYDVFEQALKAAEEAFEKADAAQSEINTAKVQLLDARNRLVKMADKEALKAAIESAKTIKEKDVTPDSWKRLTAAIKAAEAVYEKEEAT